MYYVLEKIKLKLSNTDPRSSKMRKNTLAMLFIRIVSILVSLLSVPVMLHHVDRADYGILLTLTSIVSWINMMDIGLGNGLRNKLPEYLLNGKVKKVKEVVSSCYAALAIYVCVLILFFLIANPFIDWLDVLNSPNSNRTEITNLALVVFITFCIQFFLSLINSILFAYQMPAFQSLFTFIGQVLAFIALLVQIFFFNVSSIFQIGAVNCLIPSFVLFIGSIYIFKGKLKDISPSYKCIHLSSVRGILSMGIKFFVLQIISIVLFQANNIIITRIVNPEAVVEYNLAFKYISVLTMVFTIIITPVWSATTDAYVRKDYSWINKTLKLTRLICFGTIFVGFLMVIISKYVYLIWLGKNSIVINFTTTILVFVYLSFEMLYKVYGTIINGIGKIYAQMIITSIIAIFYIPTAIFLGNIYGLKGVLLSNCIVFFVNYLWSKTQCLKLINGEAKGIWDK